MGQNLALLWGRDMYKVLHVLHSAFDRVKLWVKFSVEDRGFAHMRILNGQGNTKTNEEFPKNLKTRMETSYFLHRI
jgi:hypothetical protein